MVWVCGGHYGLPEIKSTFVFSVMILFITVLVTVLGDLVLKC